MRRVTPNSSFSVIAYNAVHPSIIAIVVGVHGECTALWSCYIAVVVKESCEATRISNASNKSVPVPVGTVVPDSTVIKARRIPIGRHHSSSRFCFV